MNQKHVEIAAKLYQARDSVIFIMGREKFMLKVDEFRPMLKGICEEKGITEMQATTDILFALDGRETEMLLAMAACVEIMEPS